MVESSKVSCPACRAENPAGQKFCGECGARLALACPACNASNPPANKFCGECGAKLTPARPAAPAGARGVRRRRLFPRVAAPAVRPPERFASPEAYTPRHLAEKILTSQSAIEGERKQVTVMFTDVSGFTAMSERLDPEEVHAIMDRAFEVILAAVHRYEGTINQFLGDGVMALFGAPIAHEDHAAARCAPRWPSRRGSSHSGPTSSGRTGVDFRMRIGINTGPSWSGPSAGTCGWTTRRSATP